MSRPNTSLWRRVTNYVRYDLKEIIFPSSLPNPPDYVPPPSLSIKETLRRVQFATRSYIDTWNTEKLNAKLKERGQLDEDEGKDEVQDFLTDLTAAAKGGSKAMKPFLQNLYQSRLVAYRDAAQSFIQGYKEGFQQGSKDDFFDINDMKTSDRNNSNSSAHGDSKAAAGSPMQKPPPPQPDGNEKDQNSSSL